MKNLPSILRRLKFLPVSLLLSGPWTAVVGAPPAHELVAQTAIQYVAESRQLETENNEHLQIEMSPLDERIQIPRCDAPLSAEADSNALRQSNVAVKVYCPDSSWFLYVMVRVREMQDVVVATSAVSPGTLLDSSNLEVMRLEKNQLRSTTFSTLEEVIGARSKRRLRPGQAIEPGVLCIVCKGDSIVIHANLGGLHIKASGIAQQDGNLGETILVKNQSSNKIIDARVVSPSQVKVGI